MYQMGIYGVVVLVRAFLVDVFLPHLIDSALFLSVAFSLALVSVAELPVLTILTVHSLILSGS